jgi:hypothetical protein
MVISGSVWVYTGVQKVTLFFKQFGFLSFVRKRNKGPNCFRKWPKYYVFWDIKDQTVTKKDKGSKYYKK